MGRIRVALFRNSVLAKPVQQRLLQAGIPAEIHAELGLARLWFVSKRTADVRLQVHPDQFEHASKLLLEWHSAHGLLRDAIRCPECNSLRVDYPQFTPRSLFTNLAMGLMAELRLLEREYYCEDCHYMWPKRSAKGSRQRRHMAPDYFIEDLHHTM
jgi:hypothetical protein